MHTYVCVCIHHPYICIAYAPMSNPEKNRREPELVNKRMWRIAMF